MTQTARPDLVKQLRSHMDHMGHSECEASADRIAELEGDLKVSRVLQEAVNDACESAQARAERAEAALGEARERLRYFAEDMKGNYYLLPIGHPDAEEREMVAASVVRGIARAALGQSPAASPPAPAEPCPRCGLVPATESGIGHAILCRPAPDGSGRQPQGGLR